MARQASQDGFTLTELVVVITILGILSAFAIPRVASLEGQARLAATEALASSVRSGAVLAHTLWLAQRNPASTNVSVDDRTIVMTHGYPDAATIGLTLVEYRGFALTTTSDTAVFSKQSESSPSIANCFVTYIPAHSSNSRPAVAVTTDGC